MTIFLMSLMLNTTAFKGRSDLQNHWSTSINKREPNTEALLSAAPFQETRPVLTLVSLLSLFKASWCGEGTCFQEEGQNLE